MSKQQGGKGNPASHRMSNPKRKEKRARAWKAAQERKQARKEAQEAAARANRENPGPTPWQQAKADRKARRAEERKAA